MSFFLYHKDEPSGLYDRLSSMSEDYTINRRRRIIQLDENGNPLNYYIPGIAITGNQFLSIPFISFSGIALHPEVNGVNCYSLQISISEEPDENGLLVIAEASYTNPVDNLIDPLRQNFLRLTGNPLPEGRKIGDLDSQSPFDVLLQELSATREIHFRNVQGDLEDAAKVAYETIMDYTLPYLEGCVSHYIPLALPMQRSLV